MRKQVCSVLLVVGVWGVLMFGGGGAEVWVQAQRGCCDQATATHVRVKGCGVLRRA